MMDYPRHHWHTTHAYAQLICTRHCYHTQSLDHEISGKCLRAEPWLGGGVDMQAIMYQLQPLRGRRSRYARASAVPSRPVANSLPQCNGIRRKTCCTEQTPRDRGKFPRPPMGGGPAPTPSSSVLRIMSFTLTNHHALQCTSQPSWAGCCRPACRCLSAYPRLVPKGIFALVPNVQAVLHVDACRRGSFSSTLGPFWQRGPYIPKARLRDGCSRRQPCH